MFGFDENVEFKKSPLQEFTDYVKQMIELLDSTSNRDKKFFDSFKKIYDQANAITKSLSYTEQAKVNNYWGSMNTVIGMMPMLYLNGKIMEGSIKANFDNIRGWCLGIIAQLS